MLISHCRECTEIIGRVLEFLNFHGVFAEFNCLLLRLIDFVFLSWLENCFWQVGLSQLNSFVEHLVFLLFFSLSDFNIADFDRLNFLLLLNWFLLLSERLSGVNNTGLHLGIVVGVWCSCWFLGEELGLNSFIIFLARSITSYLMGRKKVVSIDLNFGIVLSFFLSCIFGLLVQLADIGSLSEEGLLEYRNIILVLNRPIVNTHIIRIDIIGCSISLSLSELICLSWRQEQQQNNIFHIL